MATKKLSLCGILAEAGKTTKPHSRHFLALSLLFCPPLFLSLVILHITPQFISHSYTPLFFSLYAFFFLTFFLCANATITYSAYHAFLDKPLKLAHTLKSCLSKTLLRLLATFICALIILLAGSVTVGLIGFAVIRVTGYLGFEIGYDWIRRIGLGVFITEVFYLAVNWVLAPAIVVVESSWGVEPLRRSAYLVKGTRGVAACLLVFFNYLNCYFVWGTWASVPLPLTGVWEVLTFVMAIVGSLVLMSFMLDSVVANTVLYIKCKALRGEVDAGEYVSLPLAEEDDSSVV